MGQSRAQQVGIPSLERQDQRVSPVRHCKPTDCIDQTIAGGSVHCATDRAAVEQSFGTECQGVVKSVRVLKLQVSDASTAATLARAEEGGRKAIGKRPGRRARSRKHMEEHFRCVHHFGREGDGNLVAVPLTALCAVLEGDEGDSADENLLNVGDVSDVGSVSNDSGGDDAPALLGLLGAAEPGLHDEESSGSASAADGLDDAALGAQDVTCAARGAWADLDSSHFNLEETAYIQKMPAMPKDNEEMWEAVPLDAINVLQRLCYYCLPCDRVRLMMKILEAIVAKLQQPCRRFYDHKDRAWDVGLAVDLALRHCACLASEEALVSTWRELHRVLTALGCDTNNFRDAGGDPTAMLGCWPKLQKCHVCLHLSKRWADDGRSGEDPEVWRILHSRLGSAPGSSSLTKDGLQAVLQARLQASMRK